MATPRKYHMGEPFTSVLALVEWVLAGRPVYYREKWKHPKVLENMSLATLRGAHHFGNVRPAILLHREDAP